PEHLRSVFDFRIFIDVPPEECLARCIQRDVIERGWSEEAVCRRWTEQVEPMYRKYIEPTRAFADLLLTPAERGTAERKEQIFQTLEKLKAKC
ncbi:MAG: uridine kinase, partial [Kiritimatiellales bacterium]